MPKSRDWFAACPADGDALGNDQVGDCDPVAKLRTIQVRMANSWGSSWKPTKDMAFGLYQALTGFDPATLKPDDGTDTASAMAYWSQSGVRIDSQNLDVVLWATVAPDDAATIAQAIETTCCLQVTLSLPTAAQDVSVWGKAPGTGPEWAPGSWGSHRVAVAAFDGLERVCRTWGDDVVMHPDFWAAYVIGVDATLSREWMSATGLSPAGLDWDALTADMAKL